LCVCETIAKEAQKIKISLVQKRYGKYATVISGIDANKIDIRELIKKLKSELACGGTYKNGQIELQGNHRERLKKILEREGFPSEMIES
jgi:translation initiation factor 1